MSASGAGATAAATWWILASAVGAALLGQLHTSVTALLRVGGGDLRSVARGYRESVWSVLLVLGLDAAGGLALAGAICIFGVTTPAALVRLIDERPGLGWFTIGLLGPLLSNGGLRTLGIKNASMEWLGSEDKKTGRTRGPAREPVLADASRSLRAACVRRLHVACWLAGERRAVAEYLELERRTSAAMVAGDPAIAVLPSVVRRFADSGSALPPAVTHALSRAESSPARDADEYLSALIETLLQARMFGPVRAALDGGTDART